MERSLVDSDVLIDLISGGPFEAWSAAALADAADTSLALINPMIFAEVSLGFDNQEDTASQLADLGIDFIDPPWDAAFLAGRAFLAYRRRGGVKRSPLPDFYIGTHAAVAGLTLLTRDAARYRTCFPQPRADCTGRAVSVPSHFAPQITAPRRSS